MENDTNDQIGGDLIAWIEMKGYGDLDKVKQDLRELSERAGFDITGFETAMPPNADNGNKIVKVYTDTFEKIPRDKLPMLRKWIKREVYWPQDVCNAQAKIEKEDS